MSEGFPFDFDECSVEGCEKKVAPYVGGEEIKDSEYCFEHLVKKTSKRSSKIKMFGETLVDCIEDCLGFEGKDLVIVRNTEKGVELEKIEGDPVSYLTSGDSNVKIIKKGGSDGSD